MADERIAAEELSGELDPQLPISPETPVVADEISGPLDQETGAATGEQAAEGIGVPATVPGQAEGQEAPVVEAGAEVPAPPPSAEPPTHPDEVDIAAMTKEERAAWAQEKPDDAERYMLRQSDYTEKTQKHARDVEAFKAEKQEFYESVAEGTYEQPRTGAGLTQAVTPTPTAPPTPQQQPAAQVDAAALTTQAMQYRQELTQALGREPYAEELQLFMTQREGEERLGAVEQRQQTGEQQAAIGRFNEQMVALQEKYPEATAPGFDGELAAFLDRMGSAVAPGEVETAFFALKGKEREEAGTQRTTQGRQQQAAASASAPTPAPAAAEGAAGLPPTSDLEEIARRAKARLGA